MIKITRTASQIISSELATLLHTFETLVEIPKGKYISLEKRQKTIEKKIKDRYVIKSFSLIDRHVQVLVRILQIIHQLI